MVTPPPSCTYLHTYDIVCIERMFHTIYDNLQVDHTDDVMHGVCANQLIAVDYCISVLWLGHEFMWQ